MKETRSKYGLVRYEEPIVYLLFDAGVELGFPEMQELVALSEEISDHKPYMVLSDMRAGVKMTREGKRTIASKDQVPLKRATALLVNPDELEAGENFFAEAKEPDQPFKAFTDKREAVSWLKQLWDKG